MKIAQIAPIIEKLPPKTYGGTERVVHSLTEELVKRGHDVTLFASGDSETSARLISITPEALRMNKDSDPYGPNALTAFNYGLAYSVQEQFDIIHDHTGNISLPTANIAKTPVVITMHCAFTKETQQLYNVLTNPYVVTISEEQYRMAPYNMRHAGTVYHGLDMKHYPFGKTDNGYLLYVGRISKEKGVHHAIEVAQALHLPLIIAAKLETAFKEDVAYFNEHIKPNLSNKIQFIGEVNELERNKLMSKALCFLHPVTWPEPFGLALIESMACGTPVVAFRQGSIPEVIEHNKTGYVVDTVPEMINAVKNIYKLKRENCRTYALFRFNVKNMTDGYETIYSKILMQKAEVKKPSFKTLSYYKNFYKTTSSFLDTRILNSTSLSINKSK